MPKKPDKVWKKRLYAVIFVAALGIFVFSGYQLYQIYVANHEEKQEVKSLDDIAKLPKDLDKIDENFKIDFKKLQKVNPDIRAWIAIPGTNISYAIVQGKDNEYYLNHTYKKTENYAGAIFLDYRANSDFQDLNTFIYGHNVKHGTMFAELDKFKKEDFYKQHRYVYLMTAEGNYKCPIISMYSTVDGSDTYIMGYTSWTNFSSYVDMIKQNADFKIDVPVQEGDKIITLSTCSYEDGPEISDKRYVLHALLQKVEPKEQS